MTIQVMRVVVCALTVIMAAGEAQADPFAAGCKDAPADVTAAYVRPLVEASSPTVYGSASCPEAVVVDVNATFVDWIATSVTAVLPPDTEEWCRGHALIARTYGWRKGAWEEIGIARAAATLHGEQCQVGLAGVGLDPGAKATFEKIRFVARVTLRGLHVPRAIRVRVFDITR